MTTEKTRRGELSKAVTNHVLSHKDIHERPPIVKSKGVPHEIWQDHRTPRPSLDDSLPATRIQGIHLLQEMLVNERTLLN